MGLVSSLPTKTYQIASYISSRTCPYKTIREEYYRNPSVEIIYENDAPAIMIVKDIVVGRYVFKSDDIDKIHTVLETHDLLIETCKDIYVISSEVNIMSKPKRTLAECHDVLQEIAGFTTQFSKKI